MSLFQELQKRRDEIISLGEIYGATNIRVFGSVAREDENENSDIDMLITRQEKMGMGEYLRFKEGVENMFNRKVDLATEKSLSKYIKDRILKEARPI